MASTDRNAAGDVRQRRAFQRLAEEVLRLQIRIDELEAAGTANGVPVYAETPAGTINGTNVTFTLAETPLAGSLMLFRNGVLLKAGAGNDYTLSAATITFEAGEAPDTGAVLLAYYAKAATLGGGGGGGGGGGSGLTSPLTTKGDIWCWSSTNARMPLGTDRHLLIADSTQSTGLRWGTIIGNNKGHIITSTGAGGDLTLAPGANNTVLIADSAAGEGLRWGSPDSVLADESFREPMGPGVKFNTAASLTTSGPSFATYFGRAKSPYTTAKVLIERTSVSDAATWAEVCIATGDFPLGTSAPVLTAVGFTSVITQFGGSAAVYEITVTLTGVAVGSGLWLVMGRSGGSLSTGLRGLTLPAISSPLIRQFFCSTTTRPSLLSATTMNIAGALSTHASGLVRFT